MNNLFFRLAVSSLMAVAVLFLFSCRTQKEVMRKGPLRSINTEQLIFQLEENEFKCEWMSMKASMVVSDGNKKTSFKAAVRMRKDSLIWMSISPMMGIEVARVAITPDTVYFMNRISRDYFVGDFQYLNDLFNMDIDYNTIQSILLGNSIGIIEEEDRLRSSVDDDLYLISSFRKRRLRKQIERSRLDDILHSVWLEPDSFKVARMAIHDLKLEKALKASYSDFQIVENQLFPGKSVFMIQTPQILTIESSYSKVSINQELSFPFKIPEKYEQIY